MSVKSESKKAALKAAKKASVLPVLVGLISLLADAWTKEGTEGYPALNLAPKQKQRVLNKWAQIIRWQGAVIRQQNMLGKVCGNNAVHREMDAKHRLIEAAMLDHSKSAPEYNVALVVETIVAAALLCDWYEEQGRVATNEFYWLVCALNTFSSWTCKPNDPTVLLANIVYFEVRDRLLEHPNWWQMYQHEGRSETTEWIAKHPDDDFSRAALHISRKYEPEKWPARILGAA